MSDPLRLVADAAQAVRDPDPRMVALAAAVLGAREAGHSVPTIAAAAGLTRQRVYQLLSTGETRATAIERRLADIDGRYDELVDRIAGGFTAKDAKATTAWRNAQAGKRARKGLGPLPTVKQEARRLAETQLLGVLAHRGDDPVVRRGPARDRRGRSVASGSSETLADAGRGF